MSSYNYFRYLEIMEDIHQHPQTLGALMRDWEASSNNLQHQESSGGLHNYREFLAYLWGPFKLVEHDTGYHHVTPHWNTVDPLDGASPRGPSYQSVDWFSIKGIALNEVLWYWRMSIEVVLLAMDRGRELSTEDNYIPSDTVPHPHKQTTLATSINHTVPVALQYTGSFPLDPAAITT